MTSTPNKLDTSPEFKADLAHNLKLFTPLQIANDYKVTDQAVRDYCRRNKIAMPTQTARRLNRMNYIRTSLKDGFTPKDIRSELQLTTQQYASLVRHMPDAQKQKQGPRALPFHVVDKKQTLAQRLAFAMKQANASAAEVAFAGGISEMTLHNMLTARGSMLNNGNTLLGVAIALNVELDWLVGHAPQRTRTGHPSLNARPGAKHAKTGVTNV
jgi:hypothetical protein